MFSIFAVSACSIFYDPQPWSFVQSVGGISIGKPFRNENDWVLPVDGDVSGLHTITVKPTAINSGIACRKTAAKIYENKIYLTIITYLGGKGRFAQCPPAFLGKLHEGKYDVFYSGPDESLVFIGEVSIGL